MSMQQISAAGDAMNACAAAFIGKKDEIDAALAAARAGFNELAANVKAVVSDAMQVSISFAPAAVEADLRDGGVFRNHDELVTFITLQPVGSRIVIYLPNGQTLTSTAFFNPRAYGNRHLVFRSIAENPAEADRPVYKIGIFDKVTYNQWNWIDPGNGGSVIFENVNIIFDPNINAAIPFSTSNSMFHYLRDSDFSVSLNNCKVTGLAGHFIALVTDAAHGRMSLWNVKLDGPFTAFSRYSVSGTGKLATFSVTLINGAVLHSNFTTGTNLQLG